MYISVRNWRKFQHYRDRTPPWVKSYTELLADDAYLSLNAGERALLHGVWLAYASSRCRLKFEPSSLTRRLNLRVRKGQLEALVHAGFIDIVASAELAEGYHHASPSRTREEKSTSYSSEEEQASAHKNGCARSGEKTITAPCQSCGIGGGYHSADCPEITPVDADIPVQ